MAHRLAPEAELDLDDIWHFVATTSSNVYIADRLPTHPVFKFR